MEMGADVVKLNLPKIDPDKDKDSPAPYNELEVSEEEAVRPGRRLRRPLAGRPLGRLEARRRRSCSSRPATSWSAGGSGVIYGRNVWQREHSEALEIIEQIKEIMLSSVTRIP